MYHAGKAAASRGRRRHLLLLVLQLLPAVTGQAVMSIRLRSSETEHALILPPSATAYAWRGPEDGVLLLLLIIRHVARALQRSTSAHAHGLGSMRSLGN